MTKSMIRKWRLTMLLIFAIFLFQSSVAHAVEWTKSYGFYEGATTYDIVLETMQQTLDGGYVTVSKMLPSSALVLKLDSNGDIEWQKGYSVTDASLNPDSTFSPLLIHQTSDGGYIVGGSTSYPDSDAWLLKLDSNGAIQWEKIYGGTAYDAFYSLKQTSDGGYIAAGETYSFSETYSTRAWVLKLDGNGDVQWQKTYSDSKSDGAVYSIQQTIDGGYIFSGYIEKYDDFHNSRILKLDSNGNVQWQKTHSWSCSDSFFYSIQQTSDGGYIVGGGIEDFRSYPLPSFYLLVLKLDGAGNVRGQKMWDSLYPGITATDIHQTSDGGYILGGTPLILKIDESGNVQWQVDYIANSIQQTSDGGYIAKHGPYEVSKLDSNGRIPDCSSLSSPCIGTCSLIPINFPATVITADVTVTVINVSPQARIASVADTNKQVRNVCPERVCDLVPDYISIPRGGTLGFQATVTNNTGGSRNFLFAITVTLPNGNKYPSSGYLLGPLSILLNPYQSQSGHKSHAIPLSAPLGTYTYHGYIGWHGSGIFNECQFNFEVTE